MGVVSRLTRPARPRGSVDVRCLLAGHVVLDNPASRPGKPLFHLLLRARRAVEYRGRSIKTRPGDVVLFTHGGAHKVRVDYVIESIEVIEKPAAAFESDETSDSIRSIALTWGREVIRGLVRAHRSRSAGAAITRLA